MPALFEELGCKFKINNTIFMLCDKFKCLIK